MNPTVIGLDLAKRIFHCVAIDERGNVIQRKVLRRAQVLAWFARQAPTTVAMEACGGSHYWARELRSLGHGVALLPPQHVRPYRRGQKNDFNDALAIALAHRHGGVRSVPVKSEAEQHAQAWRQCRQRVVAQRTALCNHVRGLLTELGIVVPIGLTALRRELARLLDPQCEALPPQLKALIQMHYEELDALDHRLSVFEREIAQRAKSDPRCVALQEISGIGPVVAVTLAGWMGEPSRFDNGRSAAAALGLVPRQHSSGGKSNLGGITKCGDALVRAQVVHGARAAVRSALITERPSALGCWIRSLVDRRGVNKATVALAAKIVRIAWAMLNTGEVYNASKAAHAA